MPAASERECAVFVDNLSVLKETGFLRRAVLCLGVSIEKQRNVELFGKLHHLRKKNRVAVIGDEQVGIAMMQMPVERFQQLARRILF